MHLSYKRCTVEDLDCLVDISRNTFAEAFEKDNDPQDFTAYINNAFSKDSIKKQLLNEHSWFYCVYTEEDLVGYFKLNIMNAQSEDIYPKGMELERIYVIPAFQNKGLGLQLLNKIKDIAASHSIALLWLGVWQKNEAAVRFYERHGFQKFGSHPYYIGRDKQTDWLMKIENF